jgi:hypothetical protein
MHAASDWDKVVGRRPEVKRNTAREKKYATAPATTASTATFDISETVLERTKISAIPDANIGKNAAAG